MVDVCSERYLFIHSFSSGNYPVWFVAINGELIGNIGRLVNRVLSFAEGDIMRTLRTTKDH